MKIKTKLFNLKTLPVRIGTEKQIDRLDLKYLSVTREILCDDLNRGYKIFAFLQKGKAVGVYILDKTAFDISGEHFDEEKVERQLFYKYEQGKYNELRILERYETDAIKEAFTEEQINAMILRNYKCDDLYLTAIRNERYIIGSYNVITFEYGIFLVIVGMIFMLGAEFLSIKTNVPINQNLFTSIVAFILAVLIIYMYRWLMETKYYKSKEEGRT